MSTASTASKAAAANQGQENAPFKICIGCCYERNGDQFPEVFEPEDEDSVLAQVWSALELHKEGYTVLNAQGKEITDWEKKRQQLSRQG